MASAYVSYYFVSILPYTKYFELIYSSRTLACCFKFQLAVTVTLLGRGSSRTHTHLHSPRITGRAHVRADTPYHSCAPGPPLHGIPCVTHAGRDDSALAASCVLETTYVFGGSLGHLGNFNLTTSL